MYDAKAKFGIVGVGGAGWMWGEPKNGHGEQVQESLKQVHYDCKNLLGV